MSQSPEQDQPEAARALGPDALELRVEPVGDLRGRERLVLALDEHVGEGLDGPSLAWGKERLAWIRGHPPAPSVGARPTLTAARLLHNAAMRPPFSKLRTRNGSAGSPRWASARAFAASGARENSSNKAKSSAARVATQQTHKSKVRI